MIAAHQPATQVMHLLMEDGAPEEMAAEIAYRAKIAIFRERARVAGLAALALGAVTGWLLVFYP